MNKTLIFGFVFILLAFAVSGAPPFLASQVTDSEATLNILYPSNLYHEVDTDFDFYFHVMNGSGYLLPTSKVNCTFHLYDPADGSHILETYPSVSGIEFEVELSASLLSEQGTYDYNLWCNSTEGEAGFISSAFIVNELGDEERDPAFLIVMVLLPVFLGMFFIFSSKNLGEEHQVVKIFMYLMAFPSFFLSLLYGTFVVVKYYGLFELQNTIGLTILITGFIFFIILLYFISYAIWKMVDGMAEKKEEKMRLD